jgi:hypothetical protein
MSQTEYEVVIAEFIRSKGITCRPTVCLVLTQGSASVADQMALRRRAELREQSHQKKMRILDDSCLYSIGVMKCEVAPMKQHLNRSSRSRAR